MKPVHLGALGLWPERVGPQVSLPCPGLVHGAYPIKDLPSRSSQATLAWWQAWRRAPSMPTAAGNRRFVHAVRRWRGHWASLSEADRAQQVAALRVGLGAQGLSEPLSAQSFGLIDWAVHAHLGLSLHDTQLLAAWWMLGERLVEMATGEGKTLTMLLTAATAALGGVPVHVLTANDYLARRDAEHLRPIYDCLGLRVACVTAASEPPERQRAYLADVVHVTAKEVAFDHLRDRAARAAGKPADTVLRGLCMALIDEADGILIDEACTPLILARASDVRAAEQRYRLALYLAGQLNPGVDFTVEPSLAVQLTAAGRARLQTLSQHLHKEWRWQRYVHEQVGFALQALHAFERDVHYLVQDNAIHIIDDTTGRLAVGRAWSRGIHQMIAIKESVPYPSENETLTQTSYQAFFPRYLRLGGISGTLAEDRHELLRVYGLPTCQVPLHTPSRRQVWPMVMCASAAQKWARVAHEARAQSLLGRPVLIGTDTVAESDALSRVLACLGVPHQVLNARQDGAGGQPEQAVVAAAGQPGCITVATHMAGRGTDVNLGAQALAQGGLHVINTNLNRSRRIDRQLIGRCARQGTPGSCQTILSWEDPCWRALPAGSWLMWAVGWARRGWGGAAWSRWVCGRAQRLWEAQARQRRWAMCQADASMARQLALGGSEDWR